MTKTGRTDGKPRPKHSRTDPPHPAPGRRPGNTATKTLRQAELGGTHPARPAGAGAGRRPRWRLGRRALLLAALLQRVILPPSAGRPH